MPQPNPQLDGFIRTLHRRRIVIHIAECAGVGLFVGAAVGAILVGATLYRGGDAWLVATVVLSIGTFAGAFSGMVHRPTQLDVAIEADRQLGTAELLATAWSVKGNADDPWQQCVIAVASARLCGLDPSAVLLHRFGRRAWGGILLSVCFVSTLAALSSQPVRAGAEHVLMNGPFDRRSNRSARPIIEIAENDRTAQRRVEQTPRQAEPRQVPESTSSSTPISPLSDGRQRTSPGSTPGTGAGEAKSRLNLPTKRDRSVSSTPATAPVDSGQAATGHGNAARRFADEDGPAGGSVHGLPAKTDTRRNLTDPSPAESGLQNIEAGHVPDEARDLVREYYDLAPSPPANRVSERP